MKRTLAALLLLAFLLPASNAAQEAESPLPDWRAVRSTRALLWPWFNKEAKRFDVPPAGLVQLFAETAKLTVRYDQGALEKLSPIALTIGEGAEAPLLFDLCQAALGPRLILLAEGDRVFTVGSPQEIPARAVTVKETELGGLAASEWAFCSMSLGGRDARTVEKGLSTLRTVSGRLEIIDDGRSMLVMETGANLRRMHEFIPSLDREREPVPLVPYKRSSATNLAKLVINLRGFIKLFARNSGINEDRVTVVWEEQFGIVTGMVPKALAATLDAAIEAAEDKTAEIKAAADAPSTKRYVQFSLSAPAAMDVVQFSVRLRSLFQTEADTGDVRFVPRDDKSATMYVRCRPWLEAEVKEAAELMSK